MIVVIGTVTADLMIQSDVPFASLGGDGFRSNNLVFIEAPPAITMGGNGGNSAYVLAGLGAPTALCGAVGQDLLGDTLVGWLAARGVDLSGLTRYAGHATSTSTIIMTDAANQVVYHHLGSSSQAQIDAMPSDLFDRAEALLVTSIPIMAKMRDGGFALALARVHDSGGITALDVGPAIGKPVTLAELTPLLPTVDYFIANTHELVSLTGTDDWAQAAEQVLDAGAGHVVIKQGERALRSGHVRSRSASPGSQLKPTYPSAQAIPSMWVCSTACNRGGRIAERCASAMPWRRWWLPVHVAYLIRHRGPRRRPSWRPSSGMFRMTVDGLQTRAKTQESPLTNDGAYAIVRTCAILLSWIRVFLLAPSLAVRARAGQC